MFIEEITSYITSRNISNSYEGIPNLEITDFCPLRGLKPNAITWVRKLNAEIIEAVKGNPTVLVIAEEKQKGTVDAEGINFLWVDNSHRTFFRILEEFFNDTNPEIKKSGIEPTAVVETASIGQNVYIGHNCYIGPNVTIGDDVKIHHNVVVQGTVQIGEGTVIEAGASIGEGGYGHYTDEDGINVRVPHMGGVKLGKYVRVGANSCIARGCLDDTEIGDYTKIDTLCHIAHNVRIGTNSMIISGCEIAGSSTIGSNVWLAPGTTVKNGATIGDGAATGLNALITTELPAGKIAVQKSSDQFDGRFKKIYF